MKNWLKAKGKRRMVFVMPVILLLMVLFTMRATAQGSWPGITGNAEKNTVTGLYRWNFSPNGVFDPNLIFLGKSDTVRRNARMDSIKALYGALSGNNNWTSHNTYQAYIDMAANSPIVLHNSAGTFYTQLNTNATTTQNNLISFPNKTGVIALTSDSIRTNFRMDSINAATLPQVGQIISDNFVRASVGSNYTAAGTGVTYSIVSNSLQMVNSNSSFANTNYLLYNAYGNSNFESFTENVNIVPGTITSTSYGAGFIYKSNGLYKSSMSITLCLDATNLGKVRFDGLDLLAGVSQLSNVIIGISANDNLLMTVRFIKSKFIVTINNITTGRSGSCELDISTAYQASGSTVFSLINSFQYGLISTGGTQTLNNWSVTSNDSKNVNYLLIGDSIYKGFFTDNILNRWGEQINNVSNTITQTLAGPGSGIVDQNLSEILSLKPKNIIIGLGINDIGSIAYTDAQIQTNYASLISSLVSNGYVLGTTLFPATLLPNNTGTNNTHVITFNNWLFATYGTAVIDTYTSFYGSLGTPFNTTYTYDGVHPNRLGHTIYADIVINKLNIPTTPKKKGNYFPVLSNANGMVTVGDLSLNSIIPRYQLEVLNSSSSQQGIHINTSSVDNGLYLSSSGGFSLVGTNLAVSGATYVAKGTQASGVLMQPGVMQFFNNTGLTIGNTFTPGICLYETGGQWKFGAPNIGPKAIVHIAPGGTAANSAAFKIDPGSLLTTPESGAFEFNGTDLFYTTSTPTRRTVANLLAAQTFNNKTFAPANIYQTPTGTAGTDSVMVKIGSGKTLGAISPAYYTTQTVNDALYLKVSDIRNAVNFGLAVSVADIAHYDNPSGDQTYRVGGWVNLLSVSGGASVVMQVTWTDNHSVTKTKVFFPQGSVTSSLTAVDDYPFPTMDLRVLSGTTVQVSTTVSESGSILYEAGATIQKIQGN